VTHFLSNILYHNLLPSLHISISLSLSLSLSLYIYLSIYITDTYRCYTVVFTSFIKIFSNTLHQNVCHFCKIFYMTWYCYSNIVCMHFYFLFLFILYCRFIVHQNLIESDSHAVVFMSLVQRFSYTSDGYNNIHTTRSVADNNGHRLPNRIHFNQVNYRRMLIIWRSLTTYAMSQLVRLARCE